MNKAYTKEQLQKAYQDGWQSGYEDGYQDALIDENNGYLKDEPKHD